MKNKNIKINSILQLNDEFQTLDMEDMAYGDGGEAERDNERSQKEEEEAITGINSDDWNRKFGKCE